MVRMMAMPRVLVPASRVGSSSLHEAGNHFMNLDTSPRHFDAEVRHHLLERRIACACSHACKTMAAPT